MTESLTLVSSSDVFRNYVLLQLEKTHCLWRDGSELSPMNGDNNPDRINLARLWLLLFGIGKTYRLAS